MNKKKWLVFENGEHLSTVSSEASMAYELVSAKIRDLGLFHVTKSHWPRSFVIGPVVFNDWGVLISSGPFIEMLVEEQFGSAGATETDITPIREEYIKEKVEDNWELILEKAVLSPVGGFKKVWNEIEEMAGRLTDLEISLHGVKETENANTNATATPAKPRLVYLLYVGDSLFSITRNHQVHYNDLLSVNLNEDRYSRKVAIAVTIMEYDGEAWVTSVQRYIPELPSSNYNGLRLALLYSSRYATEALDDYQKQKWLIDLPETFEWD